MDGPEPYDVNIHTGYAQIIRDDPNCRMLEWEENIAAQTPGGPGPQVPGDANYQPGQWGQEFRIDLSADHRWADTRGRDR